jgi:hypothetical protein
MRNLYIIILLSLFAMQLNAQDMSISFTSSGISNTLDSIKVENITQSKETYSIKTKTIKGTDMLRLKNNLPAFRIQLHW